jgi:hypothetical protein
LENAGVDSHRVVEGRLDEFAGREGELAGTERVGGLAATYIEVK